jgi:hypothetical protein
MLLVESVAIHRDCNRFHNPQAAGRQLRGAGRPRLLPSSAELGDAGQAAPAGGACHRYDCEQLAGWRIYAVYAGYAGDAEITVCSGHSDCAKHDFLAGL